MVCPFVICNSVLTRCGTSPPTPASTPSRSPRASATRSATPNSSTTSALPSSTPPITPLPEVAFHPSGSCVGVATTCGTVRVYDIRAMKLQQLYTAHEGATASIAFHPSGNFLASGAADSKVAGLHHLYHLHQVKIYDLLETCTLYTLSGHQVQGNYANIGPS